MCCTPPPLSLGFLRPGAKVVCLREHFPAGLFVFVPPEDVQMTGDKLCLLHLQDFGLDEAYILELDHTCSMPSMPASNSALGALRAGTAPPEVAMVSVSGVSL